MSQPPPPMDNRLVDLAFAAPPLGLGFGVPSSSSTAVISDAEGEGWTPVCSAESLRWREAATLACEPRRSALRFGVVATSLGWDLI